MKLRSLNYGTLPSRTYLCIACELEVWTETTPDDVLRIMRQLLQRGEMSRLAVLLERLGFEWKSPLQATVEAQRKASLS